MSEAKRAPLTHDEYTTAVALGLKVSGSDFIREVAALIESPLEDIRKADNAATLCIATLAKLGLAVAVTRLHELMKEEAAQ